MLGQFSAIFTGRVAVNSACTVVSAPMVTKHSPIPLHPPPVQPLNCELGAATALIETVVPSAKRPLQSGPQLIPDGMLWILPLPVPAWVMVNTVSVPFTAPHTPPSA